MIFSNTIRPVYFPFSKYEGTGNDFILIDNRKGEFPLQSVDIVKLCHRRRGIGADGLILLQSSKKADFSMRIFNADHTEAEMCGNGLRCLVDFLYREGSIEKCVNIETLKMNYSCRWSAHGIGVDMSLPKTERIEEKGVVINAGVDHFVLFVEDLRRFDKEAKSHFSRLKININYAIFNGDCTIVMRTFERGVEQETLSCGTGATAVCYAAYKEFGCTGEVEVVFYSGERLTFTLVEKNKMLTRIYMMGAVHHVFNGEVLI